MGGYAYFLMVPFSGDISAAAKCAASFADGIFLWHLLRSDDTAWSHPDMCSLYPLVVHLCWKLRPVHTSRHVLPIPLCGTPLSVVRTEDIMERGQYGVRTVRNENSTE